MKPFPRIQSKRAVLSLCLAAAHAHAFYNPTQGRWLSRDAIGEEGGVNVYGFAGNSPITHIDLLGNDFIAVAGRAVRGPTPGNHYSIQYWLSCGAEAPDRDILIADWTQWNPARKLGSAELLASGGWVVDVLSGSTTVRRVPVLVSVVSIGPDRWDGGVRFVSVFAGTPVAVRARWNTILHLARNYEFGEQGGLQFNGPFNHWPDSKYGTPLDLPFNNSNTFVRDTIRWAGLTMRELLGEGIGGYAGNDTPVPVPNIYLGNPVRE